MLPFYEKLTALFQNLYLLLENLKVCHCGDMAMTFPAAGALPVTELFIITSICKLEFRVSGARILA